MDQMQIIDAEWHKKMARDCFNGTWDLIDKQDRTAEDIRMMIHKAHASVYHWHLVGEAVHQARGEWQVSRVYALADMGESALYHGENSLRICLENGIGDFDLAFGYEAVARALKLKGDLDGAEKHIMLAEKVSLEIEKEEERTYFLSELATI